MTYLSPDMTNLASGIVNIDMANAIETTEGAFYTEIVTSDHNVDKTNMGGLWGGVLRLITNVGGTLMRGYRIAFQSLLVHDQQALQPENQFVAATFQSIGAAAGAFGGTGLTGTTSKGGLFAANSYVGARSGYTYLFNGTSHEFNTQFLAGSSVYYKSGIQVVGFDEVQASEIDCGIAISGVGQIPGKKGYKTGILFGSMNGGNAVEANGTLIGTYTNPYAGISLQAADGINFDEYTFSGAILRSKGYIITAGGGIEAGNPAVAGPVVYDFHSSGNAIDYDARIMVAGGNATVGQGVISLLGSQVNIYAPLSFGGTAVLISGTGSPQNVVSAPPGSIYSNLSGGASSTLYVKRTGTGNTGWVNIA